MSTVKLGELLVGKGIVTQDQLAAGEDRARKDKIRLASSLVKLGHVNEKVLATFLSKQYGLTAISLDAAEVDKKLFKYIPEKICEKHLLVPLSLEGSTISIAMADPTNVAAIDEVRFMTNMEVRVYIATETAVRDLLKRLGEGSAAAGASSMDMANMAATEFDDEKTSFVEIGVQKESIEVEKESVGEKPVIRMINKLFVEAIKRKASDIHIEPFEAFSRVRLRIDGSLHELMRLPPQLKTATPSRIKVMAQMDISEKRLPQDGRIQIRSQSRKYDIRVSVLPTMFGEKVVMRLLDQGTTTPDLKSIGLEEDQMNLFREAAKQPYGMILVTGPTGSGKSTTLYAALSELNGPDVNISTVEDPVEYNMQGVNQTQMKDGIGLNFATALRALLRQDPDILMIGEIRDQETAEIAVKAALTGHMVFSTLHTNDAPSTITRLLHMGLEPFLITAALTLVEAQRLVRVICEHCAIPDERVTKEEMINAEVPEHWLESIKPMRGKGCSKCSDTGFKGRQGIFEVMYLTAALRDLIIKGVNADLLKKAAMEEGMTTLRQSALLKLYRGETTLEEVLNNSRPDGDFRKT